MSRRPAWPPSRLGNREEGPRAGYRTSVPDGRLIRRYPRPRGLKPGPNDPARAGPGAAGLTIRLACREVNVMRSRANRRPDRSLARLARWLGFDRNPLRRGTDRVEGALRLVMIILVVAVTRRRGRGRPVGRSLRPAPGSGPAGGRPPGHRRPAGGCPGDRDPGPVHLRADRLGAGPLAAARAAAPDRRGPRRWPERARAARCGPGSTRPARSPIRRWTTASSSATSGSPSW